MESISATIERKTDPIELRRLAFVALAIGIAAQILYPLIHGHGRTTVTILSVLALFAASVLHALSESARTMFTALGVFVIGGFLVEAIGVRFGLPFGSYEYTRSLGVHIGGVPAVVPLAWMMLGWPAFVAGRKVGFTVVVGAAILTTWDLFLDPQMVKAGHWKWTSSWPTVNGIPLSNTIGWIIVSALMMLLLNRLVPNDLSSDGLPMLVLAWTWFSSIVGHLFFGLSKWTVGLVGGVGLSLALAPVALQIVADIQQRSGARASRPARKPADRARVAVADSYDLE
jgi:uncharacterized membrane protein